MVTCGPQSNSTRPEWAKDPKDWASAIRGVRHKDREMRLGEFDILRGAYAKKYSWKEQCDKLVERMKRIFLEGQLNNMLYHFICCISLEKRTCILKRYYITVFTQ